MSERAAPRASLIIAASLALLAFAAARWILGRMDAAARWSFDHAYPAVDDGLITRITFGDLCVGRRRESGDAFPFSGFSFGR